MRSSSWIVAVRASAAVAARLARSCCSSARTWLRRSSSRARSAAVSARPSCAVTAASCARRRSSSRSIPSSGSCRSWIWTSCARIVPSDERRVTASAAFADGTRSVRDDVPSIPVAYRAETTKPPEVPDDAERALRRVRELVGRVDAERERGAVALGAAERGARGGFLGAGRRVGARPGERVACSWSSLQPARPPSPALRPRGPPARVA